MRTEPPEPDERDLLKDYDPARAPRRRELDTASGLDEKQIDKDDLEALCAMVVLHTLKPGADPPPPIAQVPLELSAARSVKLRLTPLPTKAATARLKLPEPRLRLVRALALALEQQVRRARRDEDELPSATLKALYKAMYEKYGAEAKQLTVDAVFPHIPPEAKASIVVDPQLGWAAFKPPPGVPLARLSAGCYLVILRAPGGETRRVIFRLGE